MARYGGARVLLCAWLALAAPALAQESSYGALREHVEQARFELAQHEALDLLRRDDLSARERNDTLELLAIAQIAARDDAGAALTLRTLFGRDPEHAPRLRDPGPQVEAAFARARAGAPPPRPVSLTTSAARDVHGRTNILLQLGEHADAVDSLHVFARAEGDASEPAHLVADRGTREQLTLTLPQLLRVPGAPAKLQLYVEARAPSGAVLARDGSAAAPLRVVLDREEPARPSRQRAWLWTSVALVVAGVAIGGAIAAR